jgi:hypothetical protein
MKFALVLGVLSIFTAVVGIMSTVRAAISPITESSNMLNDLTGIGVVEKDGSYYFTQIFVHKR